MTVTLSFQRSIQSSSSHRGCRGFNEVSYGQNLKWTDSSNRFFSDSQYRECSWCKNPTTAFLFWMANSG